MLAPGSPPCSKKALAVPLQPVEGGVDALLALAEQGRQLAVAPAEDLLQRLDAPPQPPHPLLVAVVEQQESMHRGAQGRFELLALVLGAAEALRGLSVEGVVAQRPAELLGGAVEVPAAEEELAVQLVVGGVGQILGLGDLNALDRPRVLPLLGIEMGEAEEVGGVDGVAPEPLAQDVAQAARARSSAVLLLELADFRQAQLDAQILRVEAEGQEEEVGGLVVAPGFAEPPGHRGQLLDFLVRGALGMAHRRDVLFILLALEAGESLARARRASCTRSCFYIDSTIISRSHDRIPARRRGGFSRWP